MSNMKRPEGREGMFREYLRNNVNDPVLLHRGQYRLRSGHHVAEGPGSAHLLWLPSPTIEVDVEIERVGHSHDALTVELPGFATQDVVVHSITLEPQCQVRALAGAMESTGEQEISSIRFQLANFPDVITPGLSAVPGDPATLTTAGAEGSRLLDRYGCVTCSTARLTHDGWRVDLVVVPDSTAVYKSLKSSGGYGFTHLGQLTRDDGSAFTTDQASTILDSLTAFFTFARGAACGIPICWGPGSTGAVAWRRFTSPIVDRWSRGRVSWFDKRHGTLLAEVFDGFCRMQSEPSIGEPLALALHWYRHCNTQSSGLEGSLVLGMAALDLLGGLIVSRQGRLASDAAYDKRPAVEKLRGLLATLAVPMQIPARLQDLNAFAANNNVKGDPCETLVALRNGFVHFNERRRKVVFAADGRAATLDAWWLSLWYQELALLYLLDHQGCYGNRMTTGWVGQVEPVPWSGR